nr:hypothetical protein [Tanacetum cinerariifolium]
MSNAGMSVTPKKMKSAITGRYLTTYFVLFNSKGNIIHCTAKGTVAHNFLRLKEGDITGFVTNIGRTTYQKSGSRMLDFYLANHNVDEPNKVTVLVELSQPKKGTLENVLMWDRNRKNDTATFHYKCKKGATRQLGKWFFEAYNKSIEYHVLRFRLELGVTDDTAHVVVVLFDEPATELLKCSAESLMASVDEMTYVFELKSHTYYEYGTFESFTCWKINPTAIMEEVASSTTVDEDTENPSSNMEEFDADDDCGSSKKPSECTADAGT